MKRQATNQMNYSTVKIKKQLPIYSEIPNSYQIDLTFLTKYKKQNKNIRISVLTLIKLMKIWRIKQTKD